MSELRRRLEAIAGVLDELRQNLTSEGDALQRGETEALAHLATLKAHHARELTSAWTAFTSVLGLAAPTTRAAIEQALQDVAEAGVIDTWSRIVGLVEETNRLNRLNGLLIDAQLRRTQQALDILQAAAMQQALYGADGLSVKLLGHQRSIDEA